MPQMPGNWTRTRLWQSFKRPRGGSKSLGGNAVRPDVSFDNCKSLSDIIPAQPFVKCHVDDGVEVNALIDTGSKRTFISDKIQTIIDMENDKLDTSVSERCISITGGSLNILGRMSATVKFGRSKKIYQGNVLVSTNISYEL